MKYTNRQAIQRNARLFGYTYAALRAKAWGIPLEATLEALGFEVRLTMGK